MSHGLLLFAHGARDAQWARPFHASRHALQAQWPGPVSLAFLEFMAPTLVEAGSDLARQGCTQITVVPLFLGAGGHVRKDLPGLLDQLRQAHPGVQWTLSPAVGETDTLVRALAQAALELATQGGAVPPDLPPALPRTSAP